MQKIGVMTNGLWLTRSMMLFLQRKSPLPSTPQAPRILIALLFACTAIGSSVSAQGAEAVLPLRIAAASSLTEVLPRLFEEWKSTDRITALKVPVKGLFQFGASSRLAMQVYHGAAQDILMTADGRWLEQLEIPEDQRLALWGNRLVLAASQSSLHTKSKSGVVTAHELVGLKRLGVADGTVPAGRYARQSLTALGWNPNKSPKLLSGQNVRTVRHWLVKGQVAVGIVYASDASGGRSGLRVLGTFAADSHDAIVYEAAVLPNRRAPNRSSSDEETAKKRLGRDFLEFCRRDLRAKEILRKFGFVTGLPLGNSKKTNVSRALRP